MATGTYALDPWQQYSDDSGVPLNGGKVYTYLAGTSTAATTYSDVTLLTPNANPVILSSAGRPTSGAIFLEQGISYKFILKTSADVTIATRDNISTIPLSTNNIDITATPGGGLSDTYAAGTLLYLSDGTSAITAGRWGNADADLAYTSLTPSLGFALALMASGTPGTIRIGGRMTGLSGLTAGTYYYVSATAGALTATAPANARLVGQADSTTSLVMMTNDSYKAWTSVAFSAGNFLAVGGGSWTVASGDQTTLKYELTGKTLRMSVFLGSTTIAGTVTSVTIPIPASLVSATATGGPASIYDNTATAFETGQWVVGVGGTTITFVRAASASFSASTDATSIHATLVFEVQ